MKPQTLALLAVGGLFLVTQRKATAATLATPYGGTPNTQNRAVAGYYSAPSTAAQYASYAQGRNLAPQQSPVAALLNFAGSLIQTTNPGSNPGIGFPGITSTSAPVPSYYADQSTVDQYAAYGAGKVDTGVPSYYYDQSTIDQYSAYGAGSVYGDYEP